MMRILSGLIMTAAAFCVGGPGVSAQQTRPGQTPAFRSGTELVTVDVGVVDKQGLPLRGLAPADFVVTVDGQPRRVVTAEFVDVVAARPDLAARPDVVPVSTNEGGGIGRQFVFIVDQSTLEPGSGNRVASAASRFFTQLTFADRSALMVLPVGTSVGFTWAHNRVRDALARVSGFSSPFTTWEYGSLTEARDISNSNQLALRSVGERACPGSGSSSASNGDSGSSAPIAGSTPQSPAPAPPAGGTPAGGETGGTSTPAPSGGTATGSTSRSSSGASGLGGFGLDLCRRDIRMQAESTWRIAQMTSMSSLSALREVLSSLGHVRGDKTVILISGGWPLDDREVTSLMSTVAAEAAAARATFFTIFVPPSGFTAARRTISTTQMMDSYLYSWPLETLAGMTGGGSFRAEVSAEAAFDRLSRELAGYYRIGVERDPTDHDRTNRRLKVQVSRSAVTVRARGIFDVRTFEDRDWAARLASALEAPVPATGVGLRVTSYLGVAPDNGAQINLMLIGEASRLQPGEATFQILIRDLEGKRILSGEKPLGDATADVLPFATNIAVPPGSYIVRVAVMDSEGHVGSIDHRVDARQVPLGALSAAGPLLVRVPSGGAAEPRFALDGVRQDERLALEVDLEGEQNRLAGATVVFEIAATPGGPALVHTAAALSPGPRTGSMLAQAVADVRVLPPGQYVARAMVTSGSEALGEVRRAFAVIEVPRLAADSASASTAVAARPSPAALAGRLPLGTVQPFALDQVLAPHILGGFLDRVAARPDAATPAMHDLIARARTAEVGTMVVSDAQAANAPVAAFVKGLTLLAQHKLDPAANAFRNAMRGSADFYPAMVYLGVCYAAGGNDKDAAGAWRTALIKEGDTLALHVLLADALLRQGRADLALQTVDDARARWPVDEGLTRRFVVAALMAGKYADGFQAVDELIEQRAQDEPTLAFALQVLYETFVHGRPVESVEEDRTRMSRLAGAYRAQGGPSLALVETWMEAVSRRR